MLLCCIAPMHTRSKRHTNKTKYMNMYISLIFYCPAVPCPTRVSALETSYAAETSVMMASDDGKEEEWLEPHARAYQLNECRQYVYH